MSFERASISVIIVTYRRHDMLLDVLKALVPQTCQPLEVIVNDASPAEAQLTEKEVRQFPSWLDYVRYGVAGNVSRQRNAAIRQSRGEIILFLDDDIACHETLLADYLAVFAETNADGISGLVLAPDKTATAEPMKNERPYVYNPGAYHYQAVDAVATTHVICTASFAVRRSTLLAAQGFDEQIFGSCDDVDLGVRLVKQGFQVIHHPQPRIIHFQAQATGARSPELGQLWGLTNWFYFQLKHYWGERAHQLLLVTLWEFCRPSRTWLRPAILAQRFNSIWRSFAEAQARHAQGPRYLRDE